MGGFVPIVVVVGIAAGAVARWLRRRPPAKSEAGESPSMRAEIREPSRPTGLGLGRDVPPVNHFRRTFGPTPGQSPPIPIEAIQ
ncbi:MAG TPA: hypothetical protein VL742_14075 [Casimicrobiaceae bacterium]|nr:hypothetical protein [Casimicrobiaceae bacterium]